MKFGLRVFLITLLTTFIGFVFLPESYGQFRTCIHADGSAQFFSAITNPHEFVLKVIVPESRIGHPEQETAINIFRNVNKKADVQATNG
jgi:hypothetical protein